MKALAFALAMLWSSRTFAAPCDETDNACLLKLTLQQTYALEAAQQENDILRKNLEEEIARADKGPRYFLCGMLAGIVFVGLGATIALKAIHEASK